MSASAPPLPAYRPEELRPRIVDVIRKHWVAPRFSPDPFFTPPEQVEEMSRKVLDVMLTRQFRVGPLPPPEVHQELLNRVRYRVETGKPVRVTVGYAPLKNPVAASHSRADWAEFFALGHLVAWHNKVQAIYPPGMRFRIAFDDTPLIMANQSKREDLNSYMTSIPALVRGLGYDAMFEKFFRHSRFSWLFHFGIYALARRRVRRWESDPANHEQLSRMNDFARRNVLPPPGLDAAAAENHFLKASHNYRVYWEALQLSGFTRSRRRLIAMYLDGSQHHIRQTVALHLTTLDKGQVTQPWQGEGALVDNGHGKLEPFVLTGGRRQRYATVVVDGLNLIPCPGFESIAVAWPAGSETVSASQPSAASSLPQS